LAQPAKTAPADSGKKYQPTFLDTLNKGKELVLTPEDFNRPAKTVTARADTFVKTTNSIYQVQFFTTTKLKKAEKEKKDIEETLQVQVSIIEESSDNFKLRAGKFTKKEDAEKLKKQIKEIGHKDAWIVQNKDAQ
jgi:hypothetical protein